MIMARYTTTIHELLNSDFDLGMRDYPIWDEEHRAVLNNKILNHYMFREIGFETPALFRFHLNRTLNEIMPYYNQLYATTMYEYDPIHNVDYNEEYDLGKTHSNSEVGTSMNTGNSSTTGQTIADTTGTSNSTNEASRNEGGKKVDVDTPQSVLDITDIDSVNYASNVGFDNRSGSESGTATNSQTSNTTSNDSSTANTSSTGNTTSNESGESKETYKRRLYGNYGVKTTQAMIQEERELIVNIDMQIIDSIADLFMNLW